MNAPDLSGINVQIGRYPYAVSAQPFGPSTSDPPRAHNHHEWMAGIIGLKPPGQKSSLEGMK